VDADPVCWHSIVRPSFLAYVYKSFGVFLGFYHRLRFPFLSGPQFLGGAGGVRDVWAAKSGLTLVRAGGRRGRSRDRSQGRMVFGAGGASRGAGIGGPGKDKV